ncbi:MAG TPA: anti-sigma factor [Acetobacteraceae bacterium]|jgi:anti-sigma factor RsiW|nr:anti-sigma factor [Acetobacteraceae bacterium]
MKENNEEKNDGPVTDDDLHAYVDGFLDAGRRPLVERHLAAHPEAAARVVAWGVVGASLRKATSWKAREPIPARLDLGRLLAERRARRWQPMRVAAAILLALAVGAGGGWMARGPSLPDGITSIAMEASAVHRAFAANIAASAPDTIAQSQLTNWLIAKTGHKVASPDLSRSGFRLVNAQLVATMQGPACMYLFDGPQGLRITLFMRPMERRDMNAPMRPMHGKDTVGYVWARDGLGFGLVASEPLGTLHTLANQIRSEMGPPI